MKILPKDSELQELLELEAKVKLMNIRIDEIKNLCKEIGTFNTDKFVCAVTTQTRKGLAGLDEVQKVFGYDTLIQKNLIKVTSFKTVKISMLNQD